MVQKLTTFNLVVTNKKPITDSVCEFDLRLPDGGALPEFTPGAHVRIKTPSGRINQYSLCNHPGETHRYVVAIKKEEEGQGGSRSMIDEVAIGDVLEVSEPVNVFELAEGDKYLFIAAGIGITPIYSMIQSLKEQEDKDFTLIYLSRTPEQTPYIEEIQAEFADHKVIFHHTQGDSDNRYDLWPYFAEPANLYVYCCGPRELMEEVRAMTGHWKSGLINFESFGVDQALLKENKPFEVELRESNKTLRVEEDETLLEVLSEAGIAVPFSCESGTCGSCKTAYIDGQVEHRDMVLEEHEQESHLMVCVSRGCSDKKLVLDL